MRQHDRPREFTCSSIRHVRPLAADPQQPGSCRVQRMDTEMHDLPTERYQSSQALPFVQFARKRAYLDRYVISRWWSVQALDGERTIGINAGEQLSLLWGHLA